METYHMKLCFFFCLFFVITASAAVKQKPADELARYRTEVMEIGARLSTLEKEIGSKNNLHISSLEQIKQFENDIKLYREALFVKRTEVQNAQLENKKILHSYLLESENESTEPWQRRVHFELLKQAQKKLKTNEASLTSFETKVVEFDEKLAELRKDEEELGQMIKELEERKKIAMNKYLDKLKTKKKYEAKVHSRKLKKRIAKVKKKLSNEPIIAAKPDRFFSHPVDDFLSFTPSKKGVTFKYQATQPIKAVGAGKVVYAGDLAAYGQVLLIDHGKDLRTVLLGKMNIRVRKNDSVKLGDILAYTVNESDKSQNLYFEVRKKNTAQNTILWLDQTGVSKI